MDAIGRCPVNEPLDPHGVLPAIEAGTVRVLRQSNIGTGDVCGKRLQYELDPDVPRGTGEARIVGTGYHAGQARYWEARQEDPSIFQPSALLMGEIYAYAEASFNEGIDEADVLGDWDTSRAHALDRMLKLLYHYFDTGLQWGPEFTVEAVEQTFFMPLVDGWVVQGTPDMVLSRPHHQGRERKHIIVDHKTSGRKWQRGKEDPRKNNQAPWYAYWWRELTGIDAEFTFDIITPPNVFERRKSSLKPEHQAAIIAKAKLWVALLETGIELPPNTTSNLCSAKYCDYWKICPWGQALTATGIKDANVEVYPGDGSVPIAA